MSTESGPVSSTSSPFLARPSTERLFIACALLAVLLALLTIIWLLGSLFISGIPRLSGDFFTSYPSRFPQQAGIFSALVGSALLMVVVAVVAIPLGVGAAVYMEEYAEKNFFSRILELNIANLAGVPSIIYGLLGLHLFVRVFGLERSVLAGGLTLSLLVLPIVIITTREALKNVPNSIRDGALALGATKWQVVWLQVLPLSLPGILTGAILAFSRAIGETAPLVTLGALTYVAFVPDNTTTLLFLSSEQAVTLTTMLEAVKLDLLSPFTALPIQAFNWLSRPQPAFHVNAAAAICVLLIMLLALNSISIYLRLKLERRYQ